MQQNFSAKLVLQCRFNVKDFVSLCSQVFAQTGVVVRALLWDDMSLDSSC